MGDILKFAILLALAWSSSVASVLENCDMGFAEAVIRILSSRPNHQPLTVTLVHFEQDLCIFDSFEKIVSKMERRIEYSFYTLDIFKNGAILKPKSDITITFLRGKAQNALGFLIRNERHLTDEYIIIGTNSEKRIRNLFEIANICFSNLLIILMQQHEHVESYQQRFFIHQPLANEKFEEIDDISNFAAIFPNKLDRIEQLTKVGISADTSLAVNEELVKLFLDTNKASHKVFKSAGKFKLKDFMISSLLTVKTIDISSNMFPLFKSFDKKMDLRRSYPYEWEKYCFLLPTMAKPETGSFSVMKTFTGEAWLYSGIVFVGYTILRHLSKALEIRINRSSETVRLDRSIWTIFEIYVTGATVMRFRTLFDKIFMTLFILYCYFVMQFFDSSFVSVQLSHEGDGTLRTVVEVLAQNRSIHAKPIDYEISQVMFLNSSFKTLFQMSNMTIFNYKSSKFHLMSRSEINSILVAKENYLPDTQQPLWYMVEECLYSVPMVFLFSLDSPYREAFNKFASRVWESGIHQHWEREAQRKAGNGTTQSSILNSFAYEGPIKLTDISFGFIILVIGLLLSFVVFNLELLVPWVKGFFCKGTVRPVEFELQHLAPVGERAHRAVLRRQRNLKRHHQRQRGKRVTLVSSKKR